MADEKAEPLRIEDLSASERRILKEIAAGRSLEELARAFNVSVERVAQVATAAIGKLAGGP
jgi:DNA-binding CsgD family transcriptional regulator